jgi:hypothetical protein
MLNNIDQTTLNLCVAIALGAAVGAVPGVSSAPQVSAG